MNPGEELDALIAEKVMGLKKVRFQEQGYHLDLVHGENHIAGVASLVPSYSIDIAAAWEVVEKIKHKKGIDSTFKLQWDDDAWICYWDHEDFLFDLKYPRALTAPHAICLAALKILSKEE